MTMLLLCWLLSSTGCGPMLWRWHGIGASVSSHGGGSHFQLLAQLRVRVAAVVAVLMVTMLLLLVQIPSNRSHGDSIGDGSGYCVCQPGCNIVHYVYDRSSTNTTTNGHRTGCFIRRNHWRRCRRGR